MRASKRPFLTVSVMVLGVATGHSLVPLGGVDVDHNEKRKL